ncbi:MAG: hypothetical protein C0392_13200 [Syntrophus sp. (in: bacteria)]|nr:hypothetical protein [Syntrophus sp. (in: bacteria)]
MINSLCFDIDDLAYGLNVKTGACLPQQYLVEKETYALLELLEACSIKSTMFVPGYVAQRFPDLVREMSRSGHEIGSHGNTHMVAERLQREGFREDILISKKMLEDILSMEVYVYKAPEWGITNRTPWAYDELISAGYRVDNTARPALLKYLGRSPDDMTPFIYKDSLTVIPVTSRRFLGRDVPFNGGLFSAYIPIDIQINYYRQLNNKGVAFNYYCHPFESHPQGTNRQTWRYGTIRAALYGIHFGRYRDYIEQLAKHFKFAPLGTAYQEYFPSL